MKKLEEKPSKLSLLSEHVLRYKAIESGLLASRLKHALDCLQEFKLCRDSCPKIINLHIITKSKSIYEQSFQKEKAWHDKQVRVLRTSRIEICFLGKKKFNFNSLDSC